MKTALIFKGLPMLMVAAYALTKYTPAQRAKGRVTASEPALTSVTGTVQRVIHDGSIFLTQIKGTSDAVWVGINGEQPKVGQILTCAIERRIDAYESKTDGMAFERVFIAGEVTPS